MHPESYIILRRFLILAGLYHIKVWDERITKDALVAIIAQAAWN